ncbi:MAG: DUF6049 family protein [Actinomycetes bacterium]
MTSRRRLLRRSPALVLLALVLSTLALPGAAGAERGRAPDVALTLTELEPVTLTLQRTLRVGGDVRLLAGADVQDASVQLQLATAPITARSAIDDALANPPYMAAVSGADDSLGRLSGGRPTSYRIRVPADTLPLGITGVYPMRLVVTGLVGGVRTEVANLTTLLPWYPAGDQVARTRLLWLWPVIDAPRRDATGAFTSDGLAESMAPSGRLATLVEAGAGRPVTWMVDPALLADASAMSGGYEIGAGPDARRGARGDDARRWLQELEAASARREVAVVPYGDMDVTSVLDADRPGLIRGGARSGAALARSMLGRPVRKDFAWPVDGQADATAIERMPQAGLRATVLSGDTVPPVTTPAYTPSGRANVGPGALPAVVTDPALDSLVADSVGDPAILVRQRFLAQTLLITVELPTQPRLVAIAPPRRWSPSLAYAESLLGATARAGWIQPVPLSRALRWPVPSLERQPVPDQAPPNQLPASYVGQADQGRADTITFGGILTDPAPLVPAYGAAFYSAVSTVWRGNIDSGQVLLQQATDRLQADRAKVRILSRGGTVTSNSGPIPITVANDLDQPVVVGLDVRSTDELRLQVTAPDQVRVPAGGRVSVNAQVKATTSGNLSVTAQLTTPRGRPYSAPVTLDVRVRAYGEVAIIIFGGVAALLVLAAGVRVTRRIMASRAGGDSQA